MIYDLTRPLSPRLAVFPGDVPISLVETLSIDRNDVCTVGALTMSLHAGTHIDAPRHCSREGVGVDTLNLESLIGPARIVYAPLVGALSLQTVQSWPLDGVMRLLIRTPASDAPLDVFDSNFAWFTPEAADYLGQCGVRVIGTDAPSVDPPTSNDLPAHRTFLRYDIILIESLYLRDVPAGDCQLVALPLKIVNGDAAPARVVVIR
ncbi:MAG: cyclase family protein [Anaerolineae bacterium]|nr:cyclase family protein [Thermoflexales bacterium]MDW8406204.1 cyclase family protein [Anaerolineae bacterium]